MTFFYRVSLFFFALLIISKPSAHSLHAQETLFDGLQINELLPNPTGTDTGNEFIEIRNTSDVTIDITGITLDDRTGKGTFAFSAETEIAAGGYITLYHSESFSFALNNGGDDLFLRASDGTLIDTLVYTSSAEGESINRGETLYNGTPTPGTTNDPDPALITYPNVMISEIFPNPAGTDTETEFIELENPTATAIPLAGWTVSDASASGNYTLDEHTIEANGFLAIYRSDFGFALGNTGEESVILKNPRGETSEAITYVDARENESYARDSSDATTPWKWTGAITPNAQNSFSVPQEETDEIEESEETTETDSTQQENVDDTQEQEESVDTTFPNILLSEILPNPVGNDTTGEFIELYNPTDADISLLTWELSDASTNGKFTFEDATIKATSYHTVFRSTFGFALNNSGEESVTLKNPLKENSDTITFQSPAEGTSININNGDVEASSVPTPNALNHIAVALICPAPEQEDKEDDTVSEIEEEIIVENQIPDDDIADIQITEVFPNPEGSDTETEFIELYNPSDKSVSLGNWSLSDASAGGEFTLSKDFEIPTKSYRAIFRSDFGFALNNSGSETLTLTKPGGTISSVMTYVQSKENQSLIPRDDTWVLTETPTPNAPNILTQTSQESQEISKEIENTKEVSDESAPEITGPFLALELSEFLPNPEGADATDEFIEIYNPNDEIVRLTGWTLRDASQSAKHTFTSGEIVPKAYYVIYRSDSKIALNNSGEEKVILLSPDEKVVSETSYDSSTEGSSYAYDGRTWIETQTLTPGAQNVFTQSTEIIKEIETKSIEISDKQKEILDSYPDLLISEFLPQPDSAFAQAEFIELYNPNNTDIPLEGWVLRDGSKTGSYTFPVDTVIDAGAYFTITEPTFTFALNNSGDETLTLLAPNENVKDVATYTGSAKGSSYARELLNKDAAFLQTTTPTRDALNQITGAQTSSQESVVQAGATGPFLPLLLTELHPSPEIGADEYIEIYNPHQEPVSLAGWTLRDASKSGKHTIVSDKVLDPGEYYVIYRDTYKFALNNSGKETVTLYDPAGTLASSVTYSGASKGASYGRTDLTEESIWRFSPHQTPGSTNTFAEALTITDIDIDEQYKDVDTEFELEISGADLNDVSVRWDFGDGKKSSKESPTHKYKKSGDYIGSVTVTSDIEKVTKNFTVEIKSYPKRKLRITSVMPNPTGKDSGAEYIIITNKDKKKVKLDDWSIATGKDEDSLKNHPFKKKITLKPGKSKVITRKHSAISLGNSEGSIELRAPNGKEIDNVNYDFAQAKSIPENALYTKTEAGWQWQNTDGTSSASTKTFAGLSQAEQEAIVAAALANTKNENVLETTNSIPIINDINDSTTQKKSLWQKILDTGKSLLGSEANAVSSTPANIKTQFTSEVCNKKLTKTDQLQNFCN